MLIVARKNLFSERVRFLISVGGIALAVFLISLLLALFRGWSERVGSFVEESNVDVWVASQGASDFLAAASLLPTEGSEAEQAMNYLDDNPAVEVWSPLIVRPIEGVRVQIASQDDETVGSRMDLQLVGYDLDTGLGSPIEIREGKDVPGPGEVIIDTALTKRYGIRMGDTLRAGGRDWDVVGISDGGDFVARQAVFVSLEQAQEALGMVGGATFYVIQVREGRSASALANDIERAAPQIVAFTREEFSENTREQVLGNVIPILIMILGLSFIVGLAVAGLTIYTATVEKAREYGILKAVGFKNSYLYRLVFEQSLVTAAIGFLIGIGMTLAFSPIAQDLVPQFVLFIRWQDVLLVFGATALMGVIAGYVPVRRLAQIDPTSVFRA